MELAKFAVHVLSMLWRCELPPELDAVVVLAKFVVSVCSLWCRCVFPPVLDVVALAEFAVHVVAALRMCILLPVSAPFEVFGEAVEARV